MKKRIIALLGIFTLLAVIMAGCVSSSLTGTMMTKYLTSGNWKISANTAKGYVSQSIDISSSELAALYVKNTNSDGTVSLVLIQGDINKTFDVSGTFDGSIDTSAFAAGKITIRLNLDSAKNVDVAVKWKS